MLILRAYETCLTSLLDAIEFAALPPDVRKGSAFPSTITLFREATPRLRRAGMPALHYHSTQSAMKMFVSPCLALWRFEANTSFFPSGENIGKPSNVSL